MRFLPTSAATPTREGIVLIAGYAGESSSARLSPYAVQPPRPEGCRWRSKLSDNPEGPGHSSRCPRCGLPLRVLMRATGPELEYEFPAWNRQCKDPLLGGPSMCLARDFETVTALAEPGAEFLDDPAGRPLGYS